MNYKGLIIVSALMVSGAASAVTILVDDFSNGNITQNVDSFGMEAIANTPASVLGGNRGTYIGQTTTDNLQRSQLRVASNRLAVSNDDGVANSATLAYGAAGTSGPNTFLLNFATNLSLGTNDALKLSFIRNDLPLTVYVDLYSNGTTVAASYTKIVSGGQFSPFDVMIGAADLTSGSATWNDFDMMAISFDTNVNGDFSLGRVEAVPEPATMLALSAGLVAMARRRKNRK